jgi:hypothetical protein
MSNSRTTIKFPDSTNLWSIVEKWAETSGYQLEQGSEMGRAYRKTSGFFSAPIMVTIKSEDGKAQLEAWIQVDKRLRLICGILNPFLFLLPAESAIQSGGFVGAVPKNKAREDVNPLLRELGLKPIG